MNNRKPIIVTLFLVRSREDYNDILTGKQGEVFIPITPYWLNRITYHKMEETEMIDEAVCDLKQPSKRHADITECLKYFGITFRQYDSVKIRCGKGKVITEYQFEYMNISRNAEDGNYYFCIGPGKILI